MKKFVLSIMFVLILMVELGIFIYTMNVDIDLDQGTFDIGFPYAFVIGFLIMVTLIINGFIYKKIQVAKPMDAPMVLASHDEREQQIINKYAVIGFAYFTPIISIISLVFVAVMVMFVHDIEQLLKLFGYVIIVILGLPFIIHALCVIRAIKKV